MASGTVGPPAAATHCASVTPIGTRRVTGSATAPAIVRNFSVTGLAGRGGHVDGRLDVHHHGVHGQGDAARRNDPAEGVVDEDELVARRVGVAQGADLHALRQPGAEQLDHVLVFFLDADDGPTGPDELHGGGHAFDGGVEVIAEDFLVFMEQRLALGRVEQHGIGLAGEFDVGGEAGPARADHARLGDHIESHLCHDNSWDRRSVGSLENTIVYYPQAFAANRCDKRVYERMVCWYRIPTRNTIIGVLECRLWA